LKRTVKKNITVTIFIVVLIDTIIGGFLLKSRSFSHLAIWHIIESSKKEDFYWQPEKAPLYFHFDSYSDRLSIFKNEISPLVKNENDELKIVLTLAKYVIDVSSDNIKTGLSLRWDSPEGILKQIREGASANCFYRAVLFSTYLSSLGLKSRLWALENEKFNATAHSVNEVYIRSLKKWAFIDVMFGFYITENGKPLSLLELRERLLDGDTKKILAHSLCNGTKGQKEPPGFYSRLVKCVFLRSGNDFVNKYNAKIRYGVFSGFKRYLDRLPNKIRIGLSYFLGRQDIFMHYIDRYSQSLGPQAIIAKLLFYFFIFSLLSLGALLAILSSVFLRKTLAINLSRKDTRQR